MCYIALYAEDFAQLHGSYPDSYMPHTCTLVEIEKRRAGCKCRAQPRLELPFGRGASGGQQEQDE
jgi:hypothetical protein